MRAELLLSFYDLVRLALVLKKCLLTQAAYSCLCSDSISTCVVNTQTQLDSKLQQKMKIKAK